MKCIYCLEDKPEEEFSKVEHVMPQSFGLYKNNLTLKYLVCDECNQYFGDELETVFARDTFEGVSRYKLGLKNPKNFKNLGKKSQLEIIIDEGIMKGAFAFLEYSKEKDEVVIKPLPQIGFMQKNSSEYTFYKSNELLNAKDFNKDNYDLEKENSIMLLGMNEKEAINILKGLGVKDFKYKGEKQLPENVSDIECIVGRNVDITIQRVIAKIAFNYLAFFYGAELSLDDAFNNIRRFIRYGELVDEPLVYIDNGDILFDEIGNPQKRVGHIITLDHLDNAGYILSLVSILNLNRYCVCLSDTYKNCTNVIRKGHFFNLSNNEILELKIQERSNIV